MPHGASPSSGGFRLTPSEDWLFGVRLSGDSLRFGPAGGKLLWAGLTSLVAVALAAMSLLASYDSVRVVFWEASPTVGKVLSVALASAIFGYLVATARSGVLARPDGVTVRTAVRSRHYPWSNVSGTRIVEAEPSPSFRLSLGDHGGGVRPDLDSCQAYLVLGDLSLVRLAGFESAATKSGLSGGAPSPTEIKVGALDRYRQTVAPDPSDRGTDFDVR